MTWKNDKEKMALAVKLENPEQIVLCPSCNHEITYEIRNNSEIAICKKWGYRQKSV